MKPIQLKKLIAKDAAIALGALIISGGLMAGAMWWTESANKELAQAQSQLNTVRQQANNLQQQFDKAGKSYADYQKIEEQIQTVGIAIDRQKIKNVFDTLQSSYGLSGLKVSISPIQEMKDAKYKKSMALVESGDVTVDFSAPSDEEVYRFINQLQQAIPGQSNISKFSLGRDQALNNANLMAISQNGEGNLVKTSLVFTWFGIKNVTPPAAAAVPGAPGAPSAMPPGAAAMPTPGATP